MRKVIQNVIILMTMIFFLANATYAWFEAQASMVDSVTITTGQLNITVRLYRGVDETLDGTLDYYTENEANDLSMSLTGYVGFSAFPDDIMEPKGCFMKKHDENEFYYVFEPMTYPYSINLTTMVLTQFFTYLVVVDNTSYYSGNIIGNLTGFPSTNALGRALNFNEQSIETSCNASGTGTLYFTHQFGDEPPDNGKTPKENAVPIARDELALYPLVITIPNLDTDQSILMNRVSSVNAHVMIEIEQIL